VRANWDARTANGDGADTGAVLDDDRRDCADWGSHTNSATKTLSHHPLDKGQRVIETVHGAGNSNGNAYNTANSGRVETECSGDCAPEAMNNSEAVGGTGATIEASAMDYHFCSARDEGKADDSSDSSSIVHKAATGAAWMPLRTLLDTTQKMMR